MIGGLFLNGALKKRPALYPLFLAFSLCMGISSALHLKEGPQDSLRFHRLWNSDQQKTAKHVLRLEQFLAEKQNLPIYVSFKSGNSPFAKGRISDIAIIPGRYCIYVLLRHLRDIQDGRIIISLQNAGPRRGFPSPYELSNARLFLDMDKIETCDLKALRDTYGIQALVPTTITGPRLKSLMVADKNVQEVVFFIKGKANFILEANNRTAGGDQSYGQAYEMVRLKFKDAGLKPPILINLMITTKGGQTAELVGPFVM